MSVVSLTIYKALDEIKTTCDSQKKCTECPYMNGCYNNGVTCFPATWNVDILTEIIMQRAFTGGR